jgi:hypothetical protein
VSPVEQAAAVERGRAEERSAVVAFLRRYTHLEALAQLFEDRAHFALGDAALRDYAKEHKIGALK